MNSFVSVDQVDRTFPLGGGKEYIALKGIDLHIKKGEFVNEYVGELISQDECKRRLKLAYKMKFSNFYFLAIDNKK